MALTYREKEDKRRLLQIKIAEARALITEAESLSDEIQEQFTFLDRTYTPKVGGGWDVESTTMWQGSSQNC